MKNKKFKIRFASAALSALLASGTGLAINTPTFATDTENNNIEIETQIEEKKEEKVVTEEPKQETPKQETSTPAPKQETPAPAPKQEDPAPTPAVVHEVPTPSNDNPVTSEQPTPSSEIEKEEPTPTEITNSNIGIAETTTVEENNDDEISKDEPTPIENEVPEITNEEKEEIEETIEIKEEPTTEKTEEKSNSNVDNTQKEESNENDLAENIVEKATTTEEENLNDEDNKTNEIINDSVNNLLDSISEKATDSVNHLNEGITNSKETINDTVENINDKVTDTIDSVKKGLDDISELANDKINEATEFISNELNDLVNQEDILEKVDTETPEEETIEENEDIELEETPEENIEETSSQTKDLKTLVGDAILTYTVDIESTIGEYFTKTHKVAVITNKTDQNGNPLVGATLQILDQDGNVLDEWVSDGKEHISLIPEGNYILHEKLAPEGYIVSDDKDFTVEVKINEINAGVDHDDGHDVCWHYLGVPLYYIESEGVKEEVYCVNQGWEEPHDVNYDGLVLDETNIRQFVPDADPTLTDKQLYDKVLDIIYHRSKAEEFYPDLSEKEIRFITEYALKNYTSTMVNGGALFREYIYDPTNPKGYISDPGNGDAIGQLAKHWYVYHNHTRIPEEYVELFYYLINNEDLHPEDMYLYIFSTKNVTDDGETYQNLLGIKWFDPYDENYKVYLAVVNELDKTPEEPPKEPEKPKKPEKPVQPETQVSQQPVITNKTEVPNTGDPSQLYETLLALLASGSLSIGSINLLKKRKNKTRIKK